MAGGRGGGGGVVSGRSLEGAHNSWWQCNGGVKPDGFVRLRNQTLLTTSAAVFISVIFHPSTYQFVAISFFLKKARAYCNFWGRSSRGGGGGRVRDRAPIRFRVR